MQAQQSPIARVLVVDDEVALMSALVNTLNDQGYEAMGFTRATEALARLRERKFDLLLSDLMMPEMDGIATLRAALEIDPEMVEESIRDCVAAAENMADSRIQNVLINVNCGQPVSVTSRAVLSLNGALISDEHLRALLNDGRTRASRHAQCEGARERSRATDWDAGGTRTLRWCES